KSVFEDRHGPIIAKTPSLIRYVGIAALLFVALSISFLFYRYDIQSVNPVAVQNSPLLDILPGSDKAILTLEDGSIIFLNEIEDGKITEQSGIVISKTNDGQLLYTLNETIFNSEDPPVFNTISTPRGGQ